MSAIMQALQNMTLLPLHITPDSRTESGPVQHIFASMVVSGPIGTGPFNIVWSFENIVGGDTWDFPSPPASNADTVSPRVTGTAPGSATLRVTVTDTADGKTGFATAQLNWT